MDLYLGFATTLANKGNTKNVITGNGVKLWKEFTVSTASADDIGMKEISANINNTTPNPGENVLSLDQAINSGTYGSIGDFLTDFEIKINGEELIVSDVDAFNASYFLNDPDVNDDHVLNALSLSEFELVLENVFIGSNANEVTDNDTIKGEITSNSQNIVTAFNGESLDIGGVNATTVEDLNTYASVNSTDLSNITSIVIFDDVNGGFDLVNGLGALNESDVRLKIEVVGNSATSSDGIVDRSVSFGDVDCQHFFRQLS